MKDNKNTVQNIVGFLNTKTSIKDKRVYMSILYINRYILKDTVIQDFKANAKYFTDNDWLNILNTKCKFPIKNSKNIQLFLNRKFDVLNNIFGSDVVKITKNKFTEIGLFQALRDKNIDKFISFIDDLEITLDDIFEIYTQINVPDKNKNDFFTPMDMSNSIGEIVTKDNIKNKKTISIFDGTCGIGNLLYSTFKSIKKEHIDINIEVFGNDLDTTYATFAESMFNLFNQNSCYFENKDIINECQKIFPGKKMDIVIGNPPFGQELTDEQYINILQDNQAVLTKAQMKQLKKAMAS